MVVNINEKGVKCDIYIGEGSNYANPFKAQECSPEESLGLYRKYLWNRIAQGSMSLKELASLSGKKLGCHCVPKPCHGQVLEEASKWAINELKKHSK